MKNVNYIALGAAILMVISIFLPWLEGSSSASFGGFSSSYSTGGITGLSISGGILGLLVAIVGGILVFKQVKWAFLAGAFNFLNGLGYLVGWFGGSSGYSYSSTFEGGSASLSMDAQVGLYMFVIASLLFGVFTLRFLKEDDTKQFS